MSYASYENVVTTFKSYTTSETLNMNNHMALSISADTAVKPLACLGFGFGIVGVGTMYCEHPASIESDLGL